ncbi:MAG: FimV/HubP family polar landmark protein, partial [Dongiaceae bacterium]
AGAGAAQAPAAAASAGGAEGDEVDPIAEADVYMAYGRDAQAEEILKESLGKDPNRVPVHVKLLELYANRRDKKSFEQSALKLKGLTNGAGPEWEKAAALGRSIDPGNGLYGGGAPTDVTQSMAGAPAAAAPTLDFDIGGGTEPAAQAAGAKADTSGPVDFDLGATSVGAAQKSDFAPSGTLVLDTKEAQAASAGLDFDLGGGEAEKKPAPAPAATAAADTGGALEFDLNIDLGGAKAPAAAPAAEPALDLGSINLDLGGTPGAAAPASSTDPKWQEVATKLDLAKAYEEMGDKDGARELLNEVLKDGDAAQQSQAKQMLANLG